MTAVGTILDKFGNPIWVQNPLPTDGDSIYSKDIDVSRSSVGTFSGTVTDLFDDLHTTVTDTGATDPKEITVAFNRPILTGEFRLCTGEDNFSNVKIICKDGAGAVILEIDDSANNTKYKSNEYTGTPSAFCSVVFQFHTTDTVSIEFIDVSKTIHVASHLHALKPDGTVTAIDATAGGNLKVSVEELDDTVAPIRKDLEGGGKISVGVTAVEATFAGDTHHVLITADIDNTDMLYVGKSDVTSAGANALTFLQPGDALELGYDDGDNAIYVVGGAASQNFWKGALL